eukprot:12876267-Alexandrium_andersonii.AAC.1
MHEAVAWPRRFLRVLPSEGYAAVEANLAAGVHIGTQYSGCGCSESCLFYLSQQFSITTVQCFHACDNDESCMHALCAHQTRTRPKHVFQNIEDRYPPEAIHEVRSLVTKANSICMDRIIAEGKEHAETIKER